MKLPFTSHNDPRGDTLETVLTRLFETIVWCRPLADLQHPRTCLRTPDLAPFPLEDGRKRVVESVARCRSIKLGSPKPPPATDLAGGRLLLYEPDLNLAHGLEESETHGYVDINNVPPWDTWLGYLYEPQKNFLLSWVPPEFISLVTAGMCVCPEQCFRWLDEENLQWTKTLRRHGIITGQ